MPQLHHRPQNHCRSSRGFTLVELLVVISIISLLVAMLLPTLSNARAISQQIQCASNQRQIGYGVLAYAAEYKDILQWYQAQPPYSRNTAYYRWADANVNYCDEAVQLKIGGGAAGSAGEMRVNGTFATGSNIDRSRLYDCPSVYSPLRDAYEYAWNPATSAGGAGWSMISPLPAANNIPRMSWFARPSSFARFIDSGFTDVYSMTVAGVASNNTSMDNFNFANDSQVNRLGFYAPHQGSGGSGQWNHASGTPASPDPRVALLPFGGRMVSNLWFQDGHVGTISAIDLVNYSYFPPSDPFNYIR